MMKNNNKKKKFDSNFDKRCLELVDKEGKDPKGKLYKRNISHVQRFDGIAPNLLEESEELFDDEVEEYPVPEEVEKPRDTVENLDIPTHKSKLNYTHIPTQTYAQSFTQTPPHHIIDNERMEITDSGDHKGTPTPNEFIPNPVLTSTQVRPQTRLGRRVKKPAHLMDYEA